MSLVPHQIIAVIRIPVLLDPTFLVIDGQIRFVEKYDSSTFFIIVVTSRNTDLMAYGTLVGRRTISPFLL